MSFLKKYDPEIYKLIKNEEKRQAECIRLIPSENYTSSAVMEATGTVLTNRYSEGYPGKRYYEGQQYIDVIETLAIERAKRLFGAEHANVQPYSGSPANMAVYYALVNPHDVVMGMSLPHGGHLTHGWKVNFSARFYTPFQYGVDRETGRIDYDRVMDIAMITRPKIIFAGATAYPREFDFKTFGEIAKKVNARFVADIAHIAGLIVAGVHQSPIPYADVVTTTTHKTLRGPRGGMILCKKEIAQDIDRAVFPALQGGPHNHTTAAIAVALYEAEKPEFKEYGRQIVRNAKVLADELLKYGYDLVSGGTDNHLILIDLTNKGITGKVASNALDKAGIVLNYNMVPFDKRSPFDPSGIRLGTPSVTSRGMKEEEMRFIAKKIDEVIMNNNDEEKLKRIREEVKDFCKGFSIPGLLLS
ncbi:MAG: serine hydroxymethyltransferase, partial [Nitrospinae bacterium]|nr:serine hydroxymethyltransferase [Nitrospinota bacterium]